MKFASTRGKSPLIAASKAMRQGLAPDGGLYVPVKFPSVDFEPQTAAPCPIHEVARRLLEPFFEDDPLASELAEICEATFSFPIPLRRARDGTTVLELIHGPTAAFKDVGARFLAECLERMPQLAKRPTVLVATSGDTGGAVAAAFAGKPGVDVFILYPKGRVSQLQENQLTGWTGVRTLAVDGDFDDCQRLVKEAFLDPACASARELLSANSINIGRLLPQMVYYAWAGLQYALEHKRHPSFVIPTGNLGNAMAALWAKKSGAKIAQVVFATNSNRALADYLETGLWQPQATVATLANAMDVGCPSNFERLSHLYPHATDLRKDTQATSVSDAEIETTIRSRARSLAEAWCPHSATALVAQARLAVVDPILVATAHAAKFEQIVTPLLEGTGARLDMPESLKKFRKGRGEAALIAPTLSALQEALA